MADKKSGTQPIPIEAAAGESTDSAGSDSSAG